MFKSLGLAATLALGVAAPSFAASFSYTGTFTADDEIALTSFTVTAPSTVTAFTTSYDEGGFDPILTLFDDTGLVIGDNDDDDTGSYDSYLSLDLAAGKYWVALTQYDSFFEENLSEFIDLTSRGNFTADWCDADVFCDDLGNIRTGDYAYTLEITPVAPVPLPAAAPLALAGLGALAMLRRRKA